MKTCHLQHQKRTEKNKKQGKYMSKCENIEIPIRVSGTHVFHQTRICSGTGLDPYPYGCGFRGYGSGLDRATRARPVCHPSDVSLNRSASDKGNTRFQDPTHCGIMMASMVHFN